jgi:hypothetical protein
MLSLPVDTLRLIFAEADLSNPQICRTIFNTCHLWRSNLVYLLLKNAGISADESVEALVSNLVRKSQTAFRGSNMADSVTILLNIVSNCCYMSGKFIPSILMSLRLKSVDSLFHTYDFSNLNSDNIIWHAF